MIRHAGPELALWVRMTQPVTEICQRWRDGQHTFHPAGDIDTRRYAVAAIAGDAPAKSFVEQHHYSRSYPAARFRYGLYRATELVGVAVFSQPPSEAVLARLPCERLAGVELGRLVLLDDVEGNGESWFLARCFERLRAEGIECLLSHSDPLPRRRIDGTLVMPGHVGFCYQATNAIYGGRTRQQLLNLLPDGTCFSERSMSKIRSAERGWERDVALLVAAGAPRPVGLVAGGRGPSRKLGRAADPRWIARRDWLWSAIAATCRRVEHDGNHRYYWALNKALRGDVAKLAVEGRYPKVRDPDTTAPAEPDELRARYAGLMAERSARAAA